MTRKAEFTVIGWRPDFKAACVDGYEFEGRAADVTAWLEKTPPYRPWAFVCIFEGLHQPLAEFSPQLSRGAFIGERPARVMTVVGFWQATGHALVDIVGAGDGYEAMALVQAGRGSPRELQLVCALSGPCAPLLRAEQRPSGGWLSSVRSYQARRG